MKKVILLIIGVIIIFGITGCKEKSNKADTTNKIEISVKNKINKADVWIISDTEKNRKTSVWGKATFKDMEVQNKYKSAKVSADTEKYLIRVIDKDGMYYSADGITLKKHQYIVLKCKDKFSAIVEVYSDETTKTAEYKMFVARL